MSTIWIVEYGYDGIGDAVAFDGAFTTEQKANEWSQVRAEEQLKEWNENDEREIVLYIAVNKEGQMFRSLKTQAGPTLDWWIVREVPIG